MFHKKKLLEKRKREEQEQTTTPPLDIKQEQPATKKIKAEIPPSSPRTPQTPRTPHPHSLDGGNHVTRTRLEQKKNLTAKVRNQEHELKELGNRLSSFEKTCKQYQDSIDFMGKLWNNMNDDLDITLKRLPYPIVHSPLQSTVSLYTTANLDSHNCNFSICEQRCEQTKHLVHLLVDNVTASNKKVDDIISQVRNGGNVDNILREECDRLRKRCNSLEEQFVKMQSDYRIASDKLERITSTNQRLTDELDKKKTELDDARFELKNLRQQVEKLQLDLQHGSFISVNGGSQTPLSAASQSSSKVFDIGSIGDERTKVIIQDLEVQISETAKMVSNRDSQINEKIEQISKLQQDNQKLRAQMITESHITQTAPYKQIWAQYQQQLCSLEQETNAKNDLLAKQEELKKLHAEELLQGKSQYEAIITSFQEKETSLSNELVRVRQQLSETDLQLKDEREKASRAESAQKKYDELQKRYEKKRKDFDNLMKDHDKLKRQLEKAQRQLKEKETVDSQNSNATMSDIDTLRNELRIAKEQLQDKIEETQMYATELEEVSASYSKMQDQTAKQKKQLDQKELRITELLKEQIEMKRINDAYELRINSSKQMYQANVRQVQELTEQVQAYQQRADAADQIANLRQQEITKLQLNFDKIRSLLKLKESKIRDLTSEIERLKRALDAATVRADETQTKYNKSSNEAKNQKEKVEALEKRLKIMSTLGPTKDLESELLEYKRLVQCSVCQTRNKNVTIQRCHHTFCSECIQNNLKVRNRKCPCCGEKYGQDDVKPVYL